MKQKPATKIHVFPVDHMQKLRHCGGKHFLSPKPSLSMVLHRPLQLEPEIIMMFGWSVVVQVSLNIFHKEHKGCVFMFFMRKVNDAIICQ